MSIALDLLDTILSGRHPDAPDGLGARVRLPRRAGSVERAARDVLDLARKGRSFRSALGALITQQRVPADPCRSGPGAHPAAVGAWSALTGTAVEQVHAVGVPVALTPGEGLEPRPTAGGLGDFLARFGRGEQLVSASVRQPSQPGCPVTGRAAHGGSAGDASEPSTAHDRGGGGVHGAVDQDHPPPHRRRRAAGVPRRTTQHQGPPRAPRAAAASDPKRSVVAMSRPTAVACGWCSATFRPKQLVGCPAGARQGAAVGQERRSGRRSLGWPRWRSSARP